MTEKELCDNRWRPMSCKIGTLYFKDVFFCRLDGEKAIVFSVNDDMNPLGTAETLDEIKEIQMQYELDRIHTMEERLVKTRTYFENVYGVKPEERLEEGVVVKTFQLKVSEIINEDGENTMFVIKPSKDFTEKISVDDRIFVKIIKGYGNQ
jgi:hypothetical protein